MLAMWQRICHILQDVESRHRRWVDHVWLRPPTHKLYLVACIIMVVLAIVGTAHMRVWQFDQWQNDKTEYFIGDIPAFSTTDAPYFLNIAKHIKDHGHSAGFGQDRNYPDSALHEGAGKPPEQYSLRSEPLLAVVISYLAKDSSLEEIFAAAHRMLPVTAGLTCLAVILAFGAVGRWAEGSIAGLGSSLSFAFLDRTSAGRIDTDQLNLGFVYLITALLIWAARSKRLAPAIGFCLAGVVMAKLFHWWWPKPALNWAFSTGLVMLTGFCQKSWKRPLLLGGIFFALVGNFNLGLNINPADFTNLADASGALKFPNTFTTVSELAKPSLAEIIELFSNHNLIAIIAVVGFVGWVFVSPLWAIMFFPMLILGMMHFTFGNRVLFFAAPLIWFGFAWGLITFARWLLSYLSKQSGDGSQANALSASLAAIASFCLSYVALANPVTNPYLSTPSFAPETIKGFQILGDYTRQNPTDRQAVIATWWDYGYAAMLFSDLPTLQDGGNQKGPKTHLIARALMSEDQAETARIIKFIANGGTPALTRNGTSKATLDAAFIQGVADEHTDVYLVLTNRMTHWMSSISKLGFWDIDSGQPIPVYRGKNELFYQDLACVGTGRIIRCNDWEVNLDAGTVDNRSVLSAALQTHDGREGARIDYGNPVGMYLQFNMLSGQPWYDHLVHQKLFKSSYHQLFYLGNFDPDLFTPIIDGFPYFRTYRIN